MNFCRLAHLPLLGLCVAVVGCVAVAGCGVKGAPLPPLTPPEIGRGKPTFRRATEDLAFPQVAPVESVPDPAPTGTGSESKP